MLTDNEILEIKKQLLNQVETFPEDKKILARQQIEEMTNDELEEFLDKNNLVRQQKCIFCSIIKGEIPSFRIKENDDAVALLEINPISEGHVLIIPREHEQKISENEVSFAKEIGELIKKKLKPKEILIAKSSLMNHEILNIIPVYKNETIESERKRLNENELLEIQKKFQEEPKKENIIEKKESKSEKKSSKEEKIRLPRRIP